MADLRNSLKMTGLVTILVTGLGLSACGDSGSGVSDIDSTTDSATDVTGDSAIDAPTDSPADAVDAPDLPPVPHGIPDTAQYECFANTGSGITCPDSTGTFFGQDAQYHSYPPSYVDNADGTVTDLVTGLMWQRDPGAKMTYASATSGASSFNLAGYDDWRLPTIKELFSLIIFTGDDPSGCEDESSCPGIMPFIDTAYFDFEYGDTSTGSRLIDSQWATSNISVNPYSWGGEQMFGVNFADGRIKGYPTGPGPGEPDGKTYFVVYVRGGDGYGVNDFTDNGDGTITDAASGLTWMKQDSGHLGAGDAGDGTMLWEQALAWCEGLDLAGYDDWRLPNVKELQSIVDYTRAPDHTSSAAIDPIFEITQFTNEGGEADYGFFWSSTTHVNWMSGGSAGAYVCFGRCLGYVDDLWQDVHGAGAQRSDPKTGNPDDYPTGYGPQGDAIRIYDYVRCVRGGAEHGDPVTPDPPVCGDGTCEGDETEITCPDDCSATEPVCGDGTCEGDETEITCPDDCATGPIACTSDADCDVAGACPPDAALGCTCEDSPMGESLCTPNCVTEGDCPAPPGMTMVCDGGLCVPS